MQKVALHFLTLPAAIQTAVELAKAGTPAVKLAKPAGTTVWTVTHARAAR